MQAETRRSEWKWLPLYVGASLVVPLMGCGAQGEEDVGTTAVTADLASTNGLSVVNGLSIVNGLSLVNGLSTLNGLSAVNGLMTTAVGRTQVAYLVRCALPAGTSIVKTDSTGATYTFTGLLGMAPQWQNGSCDTTCQENVSACMLAHVNTAGAHIPLWLVSPNTAVGWGLDPAYPNEEATFFGNIFTMGAHGTSQTSYPMYYCAGPQVKVSPPTGRLGSAQTSPPYVNPLGSQYALCSTGYSCALADNPYSVDGFKACAGWNNPVTVWRQGGTTSSTGGTTGSMGTGGSTGTGGSSGMTAPPPPPGLPPPERPAGWARASATSISGSRHEGPPPPRPTG